MSRSVIKKKLFFSFDPPDSQVPDDFDGDDDHEEDLHPPHFEQRRNENPFGDNFAQVRIIQS